MEICPCSPDTGDCNRCKKECTVDKMGDCTGGKRRTTKKWIQEVVSHMKKRHFEKGTKTRRREGLRKTKKSSRSRK